MWDNPSLIAKVHLSPAAFEQYSSSAFKSPKNYSDWLPWLDTQDWMGKQSGDAASSIIDSVSEKDGEKKEFCQQLSEEFVIQDYDPESQAFTLVWFEFSVNYNHLVSILNLFRQIADFKDLPGTDFLAVGYEDWKPDEVVVLLRITESGSSILAADAPEFSELLQQVSEVAEDAVAKASALAGYRENP